MQRQVNVFTLLQVPTKMAIELYMHYNLNGDYVCGFLIIKLILEWQTSTWSHVNEVTFCTYYRWLVLHMHVHTYEFVLPAVYSGISLSIHLS